MAQPRFTADGRPLPENCYEDPRNDDYRAADKPERFRYRTEAGKNRLITDTDGTIAGYDLAIQIAQTANAMRGKSARGAKPQATIIWWVEQYILWREAQDPKLATKRAWRDRCNELRKFAGRFAHIRIGDLALTDLEPWWDELTYDAQHNRHSAFSKFFQWCLSKGAVRHNYFTTSDNAARLFKKPKPDIKRLSLELPAFWTIYHKAGEMENLGHVQVAMAISLCTTMREGDIAELVFDEHIAGTILRKSIRKSENQRGAVGAAHLEWDLTKHALMRQAVQKARELSLLHCRCTHLLSRDPERRRLGKTKTHTHQVTGNALSKHFAEVRDATELFVKLPSGRTPPTFHSIRGLSNKLFKDAGYSVTERQELMAHTDPSVTEAYTANHEPTFKAVRLIMEENMAGGSF